MKDRISIKGARQHNLQHISLEIPKNKLVVFIGVSGSGKSSLAFDTIYSEGQRRYLEYLSPEIRGLIKQLPKADADSIEGLSPCLAIKQNRRQIYSRVTVGAYTDIYDFLALLYAKTGMQHSPFSGQPLSRQTRQVIAESILREYPAGTKIQLIAPIKLDQETAAQAVQRLQMQGFVRIRIQGQELEIGETAELQAESLEVVVDRLEIKEGVRDRLSSSIATALDLAKGILKLQVGREENYRLFTEVYVCPETGYSFYPLEPEDFKTTSARGACPACFGKGGQEKVIRERFSWNEEQPLVQQAEEIFDLLGRRKRTLVNTLWEQFCRQQEIDEKQLPYEITEEGLELVLSGSDNPLDILTDIDGEARKVSTRWPGIYTLVESDLQERGDKSRALTLDWVGWTPCQVCRGAGLKQEALYCFINGKNIFQLCSLSIQDLKAFLLQAPFASKELAIAAEILPEIISRLDFLMKAGLNYLELSRPAGTLSEGEAQRVQLAALLGAHLSGVIYILDEPSLGLHAREIRQLADVLEELKDRGNSILLVEHNPQLIQRADRIIEIGPGAGVHGGRILFEGSYKELLQDKASLSAAWLNGKKSLAKPKVKKSSGSLTVADAALHNLKGVTVEIPLGCLAALCGVSGSGKSTLAFDIIASELQGWLQRGQIPKHLQGYEAVKRLNLVEQRQAGVALRSTPATYIQIMSPIRTLFASTKLAKSRGYTASTFSLNKKGGRCEACEGLGYQKITMQFFPDLEIPCEVCSGKKYNFETLQVTWQGLNIYEVLQLSAKDAWELFKHHPQINGKLQLLNELGLDYLTLGQAFNTLSGGEIQRLKLVADLAAEAELHTLYLLDEPSAGLHFHDVEKLAAILQRLRERGHSILIIEHNLPIIKQADWVIELGPEGGPGGGQVIFEGTPAKLAKAHTPTGIALNL